MTSRTMINMTTVRILEQQYNNDNRDSNYDNKNKNSKNNDINKGVRRRQVRHQQVTQGLAADLLVYRF